MDCKISEINDLNKFILFTHPTYRTYSNAHSRDGTSVINKKKLYTGKSQVKINNVQKL